MSAYAVLVNPRSGDGSAPRVAEQVAAVLRGRGADASVTATTDPAGCVPLVEQAAGRGDVVVAVGGDGMLTSVVGAVSRAGGTLGLVAAGRGNDFARMLGLPKEPRAIADVLLGGHTDRVDLIRVAVPGRPERVVAGTTYAGLDARAGEIVDRARWLPRRTQYPYAALRAIATYRPAQFCLTVDGVGHPLQAANVCLANSAYYGNGMRIAPAASVTDGELDAVVIGAATRRRLLRSFPKVYDGSHLALDDVTVLRGRRFELTATPAAGRAVSLGGDGEPLGTVPRLGEQPAVVEVLPAALRILVG